MRKLYSIIFLILLSNTCFASVKHPTIVLVHGALLTSSSWAPVQSYLQNKGYNVVTVDMPGRVNDGIKPGDATLTAAADKVCKVVKLQEGPVMLAAHSQGGAIITQATKYCGANIKALVYITAVIPLPGEKAFDLFSETDNHNFDLVAPIDEKSGLAMPNLTAPIHQIFMADASDADAKRAINDMVAEPIILGDARLDYDAAAFANIPKFYVKTSKDLIISPATQDKYMKRQRFVSTTVFDTGHSPFVSQPHLLAQELMNIDNSL